MIAIKLYGPPGPLNPDALPAEWPSEVNPNCSSLPPGYSLSFETWDEYEAYRAQYLAAYNAAREAARIAAEANPPPEQIWWQKLNGTLTDQVTGIEIAANEAVRNLLTGQLVLVSTALQLGAIQPSTPQDIWDVHGVKHTMPASELIALILRHGIAWAAMFAEFAP